MCVCTPAGKQLQQCCNSLDKLMSHMFPAHSQERARLAGSEIVLVFIGLSRELCEAHDNDVDVDVDASGQRPVVHIGHISDQSLSPGVSWYQRATTDAVFDTTHMRFTLPFRIHVHVNFLKKSEWMGQLDLGLRWSVVLYQILWQNTMIGTFVPGCLDVEYFRGYGQAFVFWDPFKKNGKKDNAKPFAWGRLLAEHSEDESDGGDEGGDESDLSAEQSDEIGGGL